MRVRVKVRVKVRVEVRVEVRVRVRYTGDILYLLEGFTVDTAVGAVQRQPVLGERWREVARGDERAGVL